MQRNFYSGLNPMWVFPIIRGTILGAPHKDDFSILGSMDPYVGKLPCCASPRTARPSMPSIAWCCQGFVLNPVL